jgi:hypothetical protein
MTSFDLKRLQTETGTSTLRELQGELLLRPPGRSFHERMLRHLATLGVWLSPPSDPDAVSSVMSITQATKETRISMAYQIKRARLSLAALPRPVGQPNPEVEVAQASLDDRVLQHHLLTLATRQLQLRGVTLVSQLVGSEHGGIIPYATIPGRGAIHHPAYKVLVETLSKIPLAIRSSLHAEGQQDIRTHFDAVPAAPAETARNWVPDGPSTCRRKKRILKNGLKRDAKFNLPSDDPRFAFERLVACTNLSSTGEEVLCRFSQVWPDCDRLISTMDIKEVAEYLLQNRATITIPDGNFYWGNNPNECPGWFSFRFEGMKYMLSPTRTRPC